mgnify:CR=1 FL=1
MQIYLSNSGQEPIYAQITRQIKQQILSGALRPGDALPSIRLLARELRISVITTKRAYEDLERDGFILTQQGRGSFVAEQNPALLREEHLKKVEDCLQARWTPRGWAASAMTRLQRRCAFYGRADLWQQAPPLYAASRSSTKTLPLGRLI